MKDNLFKLETIEKIKKARKVFLWMAVWILIGELALGAILILIQSWDISVAKIQGTFLILAIALFVSVNNFIRMEKGDKKVQLFALISFISNIVWVSLSVLLMWEALPFHWTEAAQEYSRYMEHYYSVTMYHMTFWSMMMAIAISSSAAGFWISNIMTIKETIKVVKPLKITAIVCVVYGWIFGVVVTLAELDYYDTERFYQLSSLAGIAFVVTALAAVIISGTNRKKVEVKNEVKVAKTDDELRAEIEEKVRREMIEKEVRAEFENAKKKLESDSGSDSE